MMNEIPRWKTNDGVVAMGMENDWLCLYKT